MWEKKKASLSDLVDPTRVVLKLLFCRTSASCSDLSTATSTW